MELDGYADLVAIGSGGNAHVYRALDSQGREVAIKVLQGGADEAITRRFTREVGLMDAVADIEGLVPTLDSGITGGGELFLVMPLYRGGSLNDELKLGPVPWQRAAHLLRGVSLALAEAHDRQILHLDVKPANILSDDDGLPWLSDFGIAEVVGSTASMSGAMMTPAYTPPERLRDVKPSKLTDVYGLGATLFALLAGTAPFGTTTRSTNPAAVMMSVLNDPVPVDQLPAEVPSELVELIELAMAKDPDDRLASVADVAQRLGDALVLHGHDPGLADALGEMTVRGPSNLRDLQPSTTTPTTGPTTASTPEGSRPTDPDATIAGPAASGRVSAPDLTADDSVASASRRGWLIGAVALLAVLAVAAFVLFARPDDEVATAAEAAGSESSNSPIDSTAEVAPTTSAPTTTTTPDLGLEGETVSVLAKDSEDGDTNFLIDTYREELGVTLDYNSIDWEMPSEEVLDGGDVFELVLLADKPEMDRRCAEGYFVPLDDDLVEMVRTDFHDGMIVQGGGNTCGAAVSADVEFVVWYNPRAMDAAGHAVPETWADIQAVSNQMIADGLTPWCMGFLTSGGAGGAPAAEWMQNVMLRTMPLETWDALFAGELPWSDPDVAASFAWFDEFLVDERIHEGRAVSARSSAGRQASKPLFTSEPGCYLYAGAPYETVRFEADDRLLAEGIDYDFISFPTLDPDHGDRQIVRASFVAATSDRPAVTALLRHFLSPEGQAFRARWGVSTASRNVDEFAYLGETVRRLAVVAQQADDVRPSGASQLSALVAVEWWAQMIALINGTATVDEVLANLDQKVAESAPE